jgi:hypothetical protein
LWGCDLEAERETLLEHVGVDANAAQPIWEGGKKQKKQRKSKKRKHFAEGTGSTSVWRRSFA